MVGGLKSFFSGFKSFLKIKLNRILVIVIVISVTITCFLFYFFADVYQASLKEQMLHRQQISARSGASSIESFIKFIGNETGEYSHFDQIVDLGPESDNLLEKYIEIWDEYPIGGVVITDKNGVVVKNVNRSRSAELGGDLSDRDYFQTVKADVNLDYVISSPVISKLGSSKGKYVVVVASPIHKDGEFRGVLATSIILPELADKFLRPVKINYHTGFYLINSSGVILYSPVDKLLGKRYIDYLHQYVPESYEDVKLIFSKVLSEGGEEKIQVKLPQEPDLVPTDYLISMSPVNYKKNETWILAVSIPTKYAYEFDLPFKNYSILFLTYGLVSIIALSAISMVVIRIARRDSYLEGLADAKGKYSNK